MVPNGKVFYGWWVVAASFVVLWLGVSSGFYTVSVFLEPLQKTFGWTTTQISLGFTISAILVGLLSPIVGVAVAKLGAKKVLLFGAAISGTSLLLLGSIEKLWQYYVLFFFLGTGLVSSYLVPNQTLISYWFTRKRGMATGIIMAGIGFGAMSMVFMASQVNDAFGWRVTYRVLGLLVLLIVLPVILVIVRNKPQDMGLQPDGVAAAVEASAEKSAGFSFTFTQAIRTLTFFLIGLVVFVFGMVSGAMTQHAIALLKTMDVLQASTFWSLTYGVSIFGRLISGAAADRFSIKGLLIIIAGLQVFGMASLLYLSQTSMLVWGFVIFYGLAVGSIASIYPLIVVKKFGLEHFSKIIGVIGLILVLAFGAGSMILGRMYDASGSYAGSVMVLFAASILAVVAATLIGQPRQPK